MNIRAHVGKIITWKKGNIIFPGILWLLGRISRRGRGEGEGHFGEKNQVVIAPLILT